MKQKDPRTQSLPINDTPESSVRRPSAERSLSLPPSALSLVVPPKSPWQVGVETIDSVLLLQQQSKHSLTTQQVQGLQQVKALLQLAARHPPSNTAVAAPTSSSNNVLSSRSFVPPALLWQVDEDEEQVDQKQQDSLTNIPEEPENQVLLQHRQHHRRSSTGSAGHLQLPARSISSTSRQFLATEYGGLPLSSFTHSSHHRQQHSPQQRLKSLVLAHSFIHALNDKQQQRRASTSNDMNQYLLDEWKVLPKHKQKVLYQNFLNWESLTTWNYNIFELNQWTKQNPLLFVGWAILAAPQAQQAMRASLGLKDDENQNDGYDFIHRYQIPPLALMNYIRRMQQDYRAENPYHNAIHAADVLQTLHTLIQWNKKNCSPTSTDQNDDSDDDSMQIFCILWAALVHDVKHPGRNNHFQVHARTDWALDYNDVSVLENKHASHACKVLWGSKNNKNKDNDDDVNEPHILHQQQDSSNEYNILQNCSVEQIDQMRAYLMEAVLETDMAKHFATVNHVKSLLLSVQNEEESNNNNTTWKWYLYMLHMADISNPTKTKFLAIRWADLCLQEFFLQGDAERQLGLPLSPLCDRNTTMRGDSQWGFLQFVVQPAYQVLAEYIPQVQEIVLPIIQANQDFWAAEKKREEEEAAKEENEQE